MNISILQETAIEPVEARGVRGPSISAHLSSEDSLCLSEVLELFSQAMVIVDSQGLVQVMNCAAQDSFNCDKDDMVGKPVEQLLGMFCGGRPISERAGHVHSMLRRKRRVTSLSIETKLYRLRTTRSPLFLCIFNCRLR